MGSCMDESVFTILCRLFNFWGLNYDKRTRTFWKHGIQPEDNEGSSSKGNIQGS